MGVIVNNVRILRSSLARDESKHKKDRQAEISLAVFLLYAASVSSLIRVIPLKSDSFSKVFRGITLKTSFELSIFGSW